MTEELLKKQNDLTDILAEQHQHSLLPSLTLTKFTGHPTNYSTFIRGLEKQIEAKLSSNDVCLRYLEQYLEGQPKELIKRCLYMDAYQGYPEAKRILKEMYADMHKISNPYIKKVTNWPAIKPGYDVALHQYSTFLTQCLSAMWSLSFLAVLDHPHNLQNMVKKLPFHLQDCWHRKANKIRLNEDVIHGFSHFAKFVKAKVRIATDKVFSRNALGSLHGMDHLRRGTAISKGISNQKAFKTRTNSYATSHTDATNDQSQDVTSCLLCNKAYLKSKAPMSQLVNEMA